MHVFYVRTGGGINLYSQRGNDPSFEFSQWLASPNGVPLGPDTLIAPLNVKGRLEVYVRSGDQLYYRRQKQAGDPKNTPFGDWQTIPNPRHLVVRGNPAPFFRPAYGGGTDAVQVFIRTSDDSITFWSRGLDTDLWSDWGGLVPPGHAVGDPVVDPRGAMMSVRPDGILEGPQQVFFQGKPAVQAVDPQTGLLTTAHQIYHSYGTTFTNFAGISREFTDVVPLPGAANLANLDPAAKAHRSEGLTLVTAIAANGSVMFCGNVSKQDWDNWIIKYAPEKVKPFDGSICIGETSIPEWKCL